MKKAVPSQKSCIVDILANSFDDNQSVNYVVKQGADRKKLIRGLVDYSYHVCNAFGEVWISEDESACTLILQQDKKKSTLNAILWDAKLSLSVIGLERVRKGSVA